MDAPSSPFVSMFEGFRAELDEHHDRRERVIKASRDVTAASKKIIFSLQRIRTLNSAIPPHIVKANQQHNDTIKAQYANISKDLQGLNAFRYHDKTTHGNQEFMEAISFQHYLETQTLISYDEARTRLAQLGGEGGSVILTPEDYLLGVYDMTGELMRFAITALATSGALPGKSSSRATKPQHSTVHIAVKDSSDAMDVDEETGVPAQERNVLTDLRALRTEMEGLNIPWGLGAWRDVEKKMRVMQNSVEKVEKGLYERTVRGAERPKGWMPDLTESRGEEIPGY